MQGNTKEPGRGDSRHLRVVPDGESGHDRSKRTRVLELGVLMEEYDDGGDPEDLYVASYDLCRELFLDATHVWSEGGVGEVLGVFGHAFMAEMYYAAQRRGPAVTSQTVDIANDVVENNDMTNELTDRGVQVMNPSRLSRCLVYLAAQAQNVARDMESLMLARVRRRVADKDADMAVGIEQALSGFGESDLSDAEWQSVNRFVIGYSRIVVERAARELGYDDATAERLARIISVDKLNSIVQQNEIESDASQQFDGWVRKELERSAVKLGYAGGSSEGDARTSAESVGPAKDAGVSRALGGTADTLASLFPDV